MAKERDAYETKDIGIKRLKDVYEKNNGKVADTKKIREFEKLYTEKVLPKVYQK